MDQLMGPYTSQVNYCKLMDAEGGGVIIFSYTLTAETTTLTVMQMALVKLSRSQHKTKRHEYEEGICKQGVGWG